MQKYLEERDELTFDKIFNQKIGKCEHYIGYTMKKCAAIPKHQNRTEYTAQLVE